MPVTLVVALLRPLDRSACCEPARLCALAAVRPGCVCLCARASPDREREREREQHTATVRANGQATQTQRSTSPRSVKRIAAVTSTFGSNRT